MMITRGVDFQNNCAKTLFFQKFTLSLSQEARGSTLSFCPCGSPPSSSATPTNKNVSMLLR
jgi:hypothetical protein